MKKYSVLLVAVLCSLGLSAQVNNYSVVKVNGAVYNSTQKQAISTGTSFANDDQVEFNSLSNSAFVISRDNGRYIMMPDNSLQAKAGSVLKPLSRRSVMTTRSESNAALPQQDLFRYFGKDKFVFVDNKTQVLVDTNIMRTGPTRVFVAKYTDHNGKVFNKRLTCDKGTLALNIDEIFTEKDEKGQPVIYPVEIFLFDVNSKDLAKKAEFTPVAAHSQDLVNEIKVILSTLNQETSKEILYAEIESFVYASYGQVSEKELKALLNDKLGLSF